MKAGSLVPVVTAGSSAATGPLMQVIPRHRLVSVVIPAPIHGKRKRPKEVAETPSEVRRVPLLMLSALLTEFGV